MTAGGSPTPTPVPTPPVLSDAARQPTREGAVAFVSYFWDAYNYGYAAQDSSYVEAISHEKCVFCKSTVDSISKLRRTGARTVGGEVTVSEAVAVPGDPEVALLLNTVLAQTASRLQEPDGTATEESPAEVKRADIVLARVGDGWQVAEVEVLDASGSGEQR